MTANLAEFIKVFLIVFTFAGGILAFRKFMLSFDDFEGDTDKNKKAVCNGRLVDHCRSNSLLAGTCLVTQPF